MKIGVDLDGTVWDHRDFFNEILRGLKLRGNLIGIVTAHQGLKNKDIVLWLNRGLPEIDFYYSRDEYQFLESDTLLSWKTRICKENNISYLFDDFDTKKVELVEI